MGIKHASVDWIFDAEKWSDTLCSLPPDEYRAAQELSGLTPSAWRNWTKGVIGTHYKHPGMQNFLAVCNLLELDPRFYFCLKS